MHGMKTMPISFPGLFGDWEFRPTAVAFQLFGRDIYWYGILMALGVILALLFCAKQSEKYGFNEDTIYDLIIFEIPVGIIGARLYYIVFYYSLFRNADGSPNFRKMLALGDGGLAIYGTIIFCFLFAFFYCRRKKLKLWALTDLLVMGLQIGQVIGRWGNFMNREAFGTETTLPWRMRIYVTSFETVEVHPTFFYESIWNLIGLALIFFIVSRGRRFDGENTCFYFLWYGLGRAWIEGLRTDSLYLFDWTLFGERIRVSQALSAVMVIVSVILLVYHIKLHPHDPGEMLVSQMAAHQEEESEEENNGDDH